jgi:hypothetical protein
MVFHESAARAIVRGTFEGCGETRPALFVIAAGFAKLKGEVQDVWGSLGFQHPRQLVDLCAPQSRDQRRQSLGQIPTVVGEGASTAPNTAIHGVSRGRSRVLWKGMSRGE